LDRSSRGVLTHRLSHLCRNRFTINDVAHASWFTFRIPLYVCLAYSTVYATYSTSTVPVCLKHSNPVERKKITRQSDWTIRRLCFWSWTLSFHSEAGEAQSNFEIESWLHGFLYSFQRSILEGSFKNQSIIK
jgi:hypothetical protein